MKTDIPRVQRLLYLIMLLRGRRGYTTNELAREMGVSRRTIFRDLNVLELGHVPYYYDRDSGGYRISKNYFLPPVNLTITEALAILLLAGGPKDARRIPLLSEGRRAAVKLESLLPAAMREHLGDTLKQISISPAPTSRHGGLEETFERLAKAITDKNVCRVVYISFYDRKQMVMTVYPLTLKFITRAWYAVTYWPKSRELRTLKLGRIRTLSVLKRTFKLPKGVKVEKHFADSWRMIPEGEIYKVHVHFSPKVAGNVAEVQWHHSQRVVWNDDGSMEFHARVDGLGEIAWWILGYGDQAEAISPSPLRKKVAQMALNMAKKYSRGGRQP